VQKLIKKIRQFWDRLNLPPTAWDFAFDKGYDDAIMGVHVCPYYDDYRMSAWFWGQRCAQEIGDYKD
jgi:ribosome modulation factor